MSNLSLYTIGLVFGPSGLNPNQDAWVSHWLKTHLKLVGSLSVRLVAMGFHRDTEQMCGVPRTLWNRAWPTRVQFSTAPITQLPINRQVADIHYVCQLFDEVWCFPAENQISLRSQARVAKVYQSGKDWHVGRCRYKLIPPWAESQSPFPAPKEKQ